MKREKVSKFRKNPVLNCWTIVDTSRKINRVLDYGKYPKDIFKCPFCPGNESMSKHDILIVTKEGKLSKLGLNKL